MIINGLLKINLIVLSIVFILLNIFKIDFYPDVVGAILLIAFTVLYKRTAIASKNHIPYFLLFLICYTFSELIALVSNYVPMEYNSINFSYYLGNIFYMLSYTFLILKCLVTMKLTQIIKSFPVTLMILIILGVFCVTLITETAQNQLNNYEYIIEYVYNVIVMLLLSVALINYMDKGDNKSILFLISCMLIFFSEMLQLAYFYIQDLPHLAAIYSLFLVLAFIFFYHQSKLKSVKQPDLSFLDYKV